MELGVGYLSIVADTSRIPGQVTSALGDAQQSANSAGEGMGSRLAAGLGKTLKVGVGAAAVATGGLIAGAITKGIGRLNSIDDAEKKLTGLGHSAATVDKIMENALASVKGTSFGLGDAATIAAGAVASGIKPGAELERTLKLTGDAATIAGTSIGEMGGIFNKVAASNKIQGDVIAQLGDKGIPILQLLGKEMGKSAADVSALASKGKIDFATFQNAMERGLGGAALTAGGASIENVNAALGRFGATLAGPAFRQAPKAYEAITDALDKLDAKSKPIMAELEKDINGKYLPALKTFGREGAEAFEQFRNSDLVVQSMSRIGNVIDQLVETGHEVGPALGTIVTSLSKASAALGVSTWQVFLSTLDASAQILNSTLVPVLNVTAGLMQNNQGAVLALAAAFLAFKTIPALIGRISGAITPVGAAASTATGRVQGFASAARNIVTATGGVASAGRFGSVAMGSFGSSIAALGQHAPVIARMQTSFLTAASGASRLGRTAGTVSAAMTGVKAGAAGITNALGGPFSAALMIATVGIMNYQSGVAKANNQNRLLADSISGAATAQAELLKAMASGDEAAVTAQVTANVRGLRQEQQQLASTGPSMVQKSIAGWESLTAAIGITRGETVESTIAQEDAANGAKAITSTLDSLKVTNEDLTRAVTGSEGAFGSLRNKLEAAGGDEAVAWLDKQRAEYRLLKMAMEDVGPAGIQIADAISTIADSAGDSKSKLEGMQTILRALGILETDTQAALFETAEAVRELSKAAESGVDPVGGLGDALIGLDGNLNPDMPNAKALRDSLVDLGGDFKNLVASGMSSKDAYGEIEAGLQALADTYDIPIEKVRKFAEAQGMVVDKRIDFALSVDGGDAAAEAIATVATRAKELEGGKTISMIVKDQEAIDRLTGLGLQVLKINETTGEVDVTANSDAALAGIGAVTLALGQLDEGVATPEITADQTRFFIADKDTRDRLGEIDRTTVNPQIGAVLDRFMEGRNVTLAELQKIDLSTAEPDVQLLIKDAIANAQVVNSAIDQAARPRTSTITIDVSRTAAAQQAFNSTGQLGPAAPVFGGYTGMRLPKNSTGSRLPTTGPGTDRTDGILGIGYNGIPTSWVDKGEWIINGQSSEKYHRELAAINAGTFPKLPGYATGGVVGSGDLLDFVNGRIGGASGPLTGSPYNWGGVNWGDCSGAMAAIARFAVGLAPFAARFATGNMASALSAMGFMMGHGGPGDLRFGWYNGGPYGGHTAGTLPDDTNVEMGGGYGGGMVGGTVGANSSAFTDHAYLPIGPGFDWNQSGMSTQRGRGRVSRAGATASKQPEWTDKQQLDLEKAEIDVRLAEDARTEVEAAIAKGEKSQNDLDAANSKIKIAQQKVVDLQKKKDDVASWVADGPAPQAPTLSRMFSDAEVDRIDAQLAVDAANERRNEVYDDPDSTDTELDKADAELFKARKALSELGMKKDGNSPTSWSEIAGDFAKNAVTGLVSDALGVFGIPDQIPPAMQAWQMFEKAQAEQNPYLLEPSADQRAMGAQVTAMDPGNASRRDILADSPVMFDAREGVARWGDNVIKGLRGTPHLPGEANALLAELEKFRGAAHFATGGPVSGPSGVDKVPAWLTAREFVVNDTDAHAGQNQAILQAMNSGTRFSVGQQKQSDPRAGATNNFYGIQNPEEVIQRLRVKEMQDSASHGWGIR
ncbi:tape measure protein [Rhodococcus sp. GOMB7]|uniref:tape measure protein n=1 Tax=Rhodococcus sp. GOMB7 TaxID=2839033 RepID=UPI001C007506|nr:tape measure protein [Rhodococcus sp. GOMB7]MBT9295326.1 tape measure protein [Rhodococcus sp. GOMB7]